MKQVHYVDLTIWSTSIDGTGLRVILQTDESKAKVDLYSTSDTRTWRDHVITCTSLYRGTAGPVITRMCLCVYSASDTQTLRDHVITCTSLCRGTAGPVTTRECVSVCLTCYTNPFHFTSICVCKTTHKSVDGCRPNGSNGQAVTLYKW